MAGTSREVQKQGKKSRLDHWSGNQSKILWYYPRQSPCLMSTTALLTRVDHDFSYRLGPTFPVAGASRELKHKSVLHGLVILALQKLQSSS